MKVFKEITPWAFLCNESWDCDNLKPVIFKAVHDGKKSIELEQKLNAYVEDMFCDNNDVSRTQLNDFLRFNSDDILKAIGLEEYI